MARQRRSTASVLQALGRRIAEFRRAQGLTQERAAERFGMLPSNYARIEQGRRNLTVDTIVRVSNMLGVSPAELFARPADLAPARPGRPRTRKWHRTSPVVD